MSVITQDRHSALILAAWEGHTEVVVELVKAKANLDLQIKVCSMTKSTHTLSCSVDTALVLLLHTVHSTYTISRHV